MNMDLETRPGSDMPDQQKANCPWRRYFARSLDLSIYSLLWYSVSYFGFHWNAGRNQTGQIWLDLIICGVLMLLIEPLLLKLIGTTPGKAVFGIRVTNSDGGKLSIYQGYVRTWRVIARGQGYVIIPIYNIIRQYKSYKECKENGEMEWDEDIKYAIRDKNPLRHIAFILCSVLLTAALFFIPYMADIPRHRGDLSAQQFTDNMNRSMRYHGLDGGVGSTGSGPYMAVGTFSLIKTPELGVVETEGLVTEVSLSITDADPMSIWNMQDWINCAINSYIGAQRDMSFIRMHFSDITKASNGVAYYSYGFSAAGVEATYSVMVDGQPVPEIGFWDAVSSGTSVIDVYFVMRKI